MHFSHNHPQKGVSGDPIWTPFRRGSGAQITLTAVWEPIALYGLGPSNGVPPIRGTPNLGVPRIWGVWAMGPIPQ